jgi:hypothetical protein
VSALTLQVLFDANADAMSTKAQAWLALAEALDNATEDLIHGSRSGCVRAHRVAVSCIDAPAGDYHAVRGSECAT